MNSQIVVQDIRQIVAGIKKEAKALAGKTLLISGGSGFLGRYIVATVDFLNKKVLKKPCRVISVDNFITGDRRDLVELSTRNICRITHDICKPLSLNGPVDYIMHAAGIASPIYYKQHPLETIETTIGGVKNLLELARRKKVKSFLFFSSSEIYGNPDPRFIPTPETYWGNVSSVGPRACYDESKRLGETVCMVYYELYKIPVKIVRPFNVYGAGMKINDYRVVPVFLVKGLQKEDLPVHDTGNQTRTFCYISDATTAFFKVLLSSKNGEIYNVGSDEDEINMMSLAKIVARLFDNKIKVKRISYPDSYPKQEPQRRRPDLTKIKKKLGYRPKVDLESGLKRALQWFTEEMKRNEKKP